MRLPARFLTALAQTFATMSLYGERHRARERAIDSLHGLVQELQAEDPRPEFTFLGGDVLYGREPLWELKSWGWARKLAGVGVERLELTGAVTRPDLEVFLEQLMGRLSATSHSAEVRPSRPTAIRFGVVRVRGEREDPTAEQDGGGAETAGDPGSLPFDLREEADAVQWFHEELRRGDDLHLLEAEAVVRSLSVAMHGDHQFLIPLLQMKRFDQYTTTHALNVSVLGMALGEFVGLGSREVRAVGISGLLHDLGKTRIPREILVKPGKLTDDERAIMNNHTVEGARLILETDHHLDLAAVVAYEHHLRIDGSGYPRLSYRRACHECSDLVHVCDVYDALRTERPYRAAWDHERVIDYIREGIGTEFEPRIGTAFVKMMDEWQPRVAVLEDGDETASVEADAPLPEGGRSSGPSSGGTEAAEGRGREVEEGGTG